MVEEAQSAYKKLYKHNVDLAKGIESKVGIENPTEFEDRIKCYLEFNNPDSKHADLLEQGVDYIFNGAPTDELKKKLPGAKNKAVAKIHSLDKKEDEANRPEESNTESNRYLSSYIIGILVKYGFMLAEEYIPVPGLKVHKVPDPVDIL